ncbi:MAG TPA: hypothetical protein PKK78_21320 [Kouleothrix sp.]|nr:hypothetical protein [Kouleothrix sp.]
MNRLPRIVRWLPVLGLGLVISACGTQAATPAPTSAPLPPATALPTVAPAPTSVPLPNSAPEPTAQPVPVPELYYIDQGSVFAQAIDGMPRKVASLSGTVLDATLVGDTLLVLRDTGLERIHLPDGAASTVQTFTPVAGPGSSLLLTRDQTIFYAAHVDDAQAVFGKTLIGSYDVARGTATTLLTADGSARPLGLTPDGAGLYLLPVGGDPSFGQVQVIDVRTGAVRAELAVEGEGVPAVSPDGRRLVVPARRFSASDPNAEPASLLYLYDLTQQPVTRQEIVPPQAPSAANSLFWSPDSRAFYFALGAGNIYELTTSYGLWVYDIASSKASKLADVDVLNTFFGGQTHSDVALLRRTMTQESQLIDLATGAATPFAIAPSAMIAGWR